MERTTVLSGGDGVRIRIDRAGARSWSELFAHVDCLRDRIHPEFPGEPPFE
jgi:hypothetical protein